MSTTATPDALSPTTARGPSPGRRRRPSQLLRTQARLFLREPVTLLWTLAVPLIILVAIGAAAGGKHEQDLGGLRVIDTYVPTLAVFSLAMLAVNVLPPTLATDRERGILRRLATTPVRPSRLLAVQLVIHAAVAVVSLLAVVAVGRLAFDVALPDPFPAFLVILVLTGASLLAIGVLIAAIAPTVRAANGLGALAFFPLMFFGGLWIPRETMSDTLRHVSDATPVGAAVGALQDVTTGGTWPSVGALGVIAAWGIVVGVLATRHFRWQ
ncbi:ABC transporter permease [Patulibacter minatonensis]|uniref:ABC transporter permease n=1 Tax=Patulibacter minatonensis TaxID=298163 RepID=UPI00047DD755|nr:ABC transporter permease [Patulibacter minatonensis]